MMYESLSYCAEKIFCQNKDMFISMFMANENTDGICLSSEIAKVVVEYLNQVKSHYTFARKRKQIFFMQKVEIFLITILMANLDKIINIFKTFIPGGEIKGEVGVCACACMCVNVCISKVKNLKKMAGCVTSSSLISPVTPKREKSPFFPLLKLQW